MATKSITEKTAIVNLKSPKAIADFSKELKKFIVDQKLYTDIKGKNYVNVEGWQFAGASMGIFPVPTSLEDVSSAPDTKYKATVELIRLETSEVVGRGFAICSSKEPMRKGADEFVIASMAQTRATGKAFRLSIGWVMKLAGYEATPTEEMEESKQEVDSSSTNEMPVEDVKLLVTAKLEAMTPADKLRFLRESAGVINEKSLTDGNYRYLYVKLSQGKEDGQ